MRRQGRGARPNPHRSLTAVVALSAIAPLLAEPTVRAEQTSQLVLGETAAVRETAGAWRRVVTHGDGYEGWMHVGYVCELADEAAEAWRARATGWSEGADLELDGGTVRLPLRARLALGSDRVTLPDGRGGRLVRGAVRDLALVIADARRVPAEAWAARHFLGAPYQWGGVTPWGVDCSGLVQTTYAARGIRLPRDSALQFGCGTEVGLDLIRPGDLLFFRAESGTHINHVAFVAAGDTLVHSTLACGGVVRESWRPGTRAAVLHERLAGARRIEA